MTRPILLSKQRQESLHICDFDVAEWHRGRSATLNLVLVALAIPSLLLVASVGGMGMLMVRLKLLCCELLGIIIGGAIVRRLVGKRNLSLSS